MAMKRLIKGLTSPWSLGFSTFGAMYGFYHIWDSTQSGTKYELAEDLAGKTYIVTGATSGIGQVTAEELAKRNARVIMACRNREKCVQARRDIVLATRNKQVYCRQCDLEDFDSIRQFVQKMCHGKFELDRIDGVVHNAAMMTDKRKVNKVVFFVFVLVEYFEDEKKYDGYEAYKKSKLANAMFAKELALRLKDTNISVFVADPGRTKSSLSNQLDGQQFFLSRWLLMPVSFIMGERKVEKAVRPVLYAAADPVLNEKTGLFIDRERNETEWPAVEDAEARKKVWATSEVWSKLSTHMNELKHELGAAAIQFGSAPSATDAQQATGRSWKHLWLW
ncbi:hypothetical protein WR25_04854 [Diploscapter pachys]|uniref:Uncharacterized protein n=1 Tax=Diploscapter pachys TaxID=2018661 RepID=A0A2A2LXY5_9BILA|nr:hypothetical protein WR25_04854 [Diploscapter pachys]